MPSGSYGRGAAGANYSFGWRSKGRAGLTIWFAGQIKLTFGRRAIATAPTFRLRRAGSRGRDHSSLRRLKPCNPSVRPPGSSETDRASADRLWLFRRARAAKPAARRGSGSGGGLHHAPLDEDALGDVLPQGHEKLARQRHDRALAALRASL